MSFEFERDGIVYRVSTETPADSFSRVVVQEQVKPETSMEGDSDE
jgi:hypothetical protein